MIHPVSDAKHVVTVTNKSSNEQQNDIVIAENDGMSHKNKRKIIDSW